MTPCDVLQRMINHARKLRTVLAFAVFAEAPLGLLRVEPSRVTMYLFRRNHADDFTEMRIDEVFVVVQRGLLAVQIIADRLRFDAPENTGFFVGFTSGGGGAIGIALDPSFREGPTASASADQQEVDLIVLKSITDGSYVIARETKFLGTGNQPTDSTSGLDPFNDRHSQLLQQPG